MFFLVPVTTSVVAASTVPPVKVSVARTEVSASPVVSVVVPETCAVVPAPPAPSAESPDAVVASTAPLASAFFPVTQEDSDVPLSQFLAKPVGSSAISPRVGEDVCPTLENEKTGAQKIVREKGTGVAAKTSPCFSRYLPNFAKTFSRPSTQGEFSFNCYFPFSLFFFLSQLFVFVIIIIRMVCNFDAYLQFRCLVVIIDCSMCFAVTPSKPAVSSGKRRRTVTLASVAQSQTFQIESSGGEESLAGLGAYTTQQAALLGEAVASELETRAVEPFVAS